MRITSRVFCALSLACAVAIPAADAARRGPGKPVSPIAIVINGVRLEGNPPPRMHLGHLLVPVRRTILGLGFDFEQSGNRITTHAGYKSIVLVLGSATAYVNAAPVTLDAPPIEIDSALYVPLRFFTDALGAQAQYDRQTSSVIITSTLVGRSGNGILGSGPGAEQTGTVTAVDFLSQPATITLTYNASVRTLKIAPDAQITIQDVTANTSSNGTLDEIRAGDFANLYLDNARRVKRIVDAYGSRNGTIVAIASGQFVMRDGHVITPERDTTVSLNGAGAALANLRPGDLVTVRYNIDSSQVRDIAAIRPVPVSQTVLGGPAISSIAFDGPDALRPGESFGVTLHGTPGGTADYDLATYVTGLPLRESQPGVYRGGYRIPSGLNVAQAPLFGHLSVRGVAAVQAQSARGLSIASAPPGFGSDFAPDAGATVNNDRPSVYATFVATTVAVNPSSESISLNGHDVTSESTRTPAFIQYTAGRSWGSGPVRVDVRVSDMAGNVGTKSWTFFIKTR